MRCGAYCSIEFPGGDPAIQRMTAVLEPKYRPWRLGATLFSLFGVLALVVAGFGVYSTVSLLMSASGRTSSAFAPR